MAEGSTRAWHIVRRGMVFTRSMGAASNQAGRGDAAGLRILKVDPSARLGTVTCYRQESAGEGWVLTKQVIQEGGAEEV